MKPYILECEFCSERLVVKKDCGPLDKVVCPCCGSDSSGEATADVLSACVKQDLKALCAELAGKGHMPQILHLASSCGATVDKVEKAVVREALRRISES